MTDLLMDDDDDVVDELHSPDEDDDDTYCVVPSPDEDEGFPDFRHDGKGPQL